MKLKRVRRKYVASILSAYPLKSKISYFIEEYIKFNSNLLYKE